MLWGEEKSIRLSFFFPLSPSFWNRPVAGCGVVSSFERMCEGMIRLQMAVFWCACVCACLCFWVWGLMFPGFVVVMSVSLQTTAVMWHWALTDSLSRCSVPTDPYWVYFLRDHNPLINATLLLNADGVAPSLSIHLSCFISFSFSESEFHPPSPLPPSSPFHEASVLCLLELNRRPLCLALSLAEPGHMVTEWAALLCYPPSSLGVHME